MRRVVIVVNRPEFFLSHRLALAQRAMKEGFDVAVVTCAGDAAEQIRAAGISWIPMRLDTGGMRPWRDFHTFIDLLRLFRRLRPDVVHNVTIKPVLYGTLAARIANIPHVVNAVSGLGYLFTARRIFYSTFGTALYRIFMRHPRMHVIVQNVEDRTFFIEKKLAPAQAVILVRGSGVDVERFRPQRKERHQKIVIQTSRAVGDKGVREFIQAARLVRARRPTVRFQLAGGLYPDNPSAISEGEMRKVQDEGVVEWLGHRDDVAELLAEASIFCLASYREGLPKSLLEAAATGLPIVTTDIAGCREVVRDGVNGVLVPTRDPAALAAAIEHLLDDEQFATRLGAASRISVEREFSLDTILTQQIALYGDPARS